MLRRFPLSPARAATVVTAGAVALASLALPGVGHAQAPEAQAAHTTTAAAAEVPRRIWSRDTASRSLESSPKMGDISGDGKPDIVVGSHNGLIHGIHGTSGADVGGWPTWTPNRVDSSAAIADLDGNGRNEVYIGSGNWEVAAGSLDAFNHDGSLRWRYFANDRVFPKPSIHSAPAIGDITGDGDPDINFGSLGLESIHSLNRHGARHRGFPFYADDTIFSSPALVDVTGDGVKEMIIGGDSFIGGPVDHQGGMVRAVRGNGSLVWEYRVNDIVRGGPSVGDIDGDGRLDIVFGGGDFYGGTDSTKVYALNLDGSRKPGWPQNTNGVTNASPTLADVSGDGVLDVVIGTFASMHGRGAGGSIYGWTGSGAPLGGFPFRSPGGAVQGQVVTADLTGDGRQDLLFGSGGGVWAHASNGARLFSLAEGLSTTFQNSPLVADLDGNGRLDIVLAGAKNNGGGLVQRYEMPSTRARIGRLAMPQFRLDARNTGAQLSLASARPITTGCPAGQVPTSRFRDVATGSTHRPAIDCVAWWDIAFGKDGLYASSEMVHRDQMATFIARLVTRSGGNLPANPPDAFDDDDGNTHELNINKLAAVDIVKGKSGRSYAPGERVNRDQMATFLMRAYTHRTGRSPSTSINFFADASGSTHRANINKAAASGLTGGSDSGAYNPLHPVPRDQMASFLARLLDLVVVDTGAPTP